MCNSFFSNGEGEKRLAKFSPENPGFMPEHQQNMNRIENLSSQADYGYGYHHYIDVEQRIDQYNTRLAQAVGRVSAATAGNILQGSGFERTLGGAQTQIRIPLRMQREMESSPQNFRIVDRQYPQVRLRLENNQVQYWNPQQGSWLRPPASMVGRLTVNYIGSDPYLRNNTGRAENMYSFAALIGASYDAQGIMQGRQQINVYYHVQNLETRLFRSVENVIGRLDQIAGVDADQTLQAELQRQEIARLEQCVRATDNAQKLQTISSRTFSNRFTVQNNSIDRVYRLRLPQGVRAEIVSVDAEGNVTSTVASADYTTVSGRMEFAHMPASAMRGFNEQTHRLRISGNVPGGRPLLATGERKNSVHDLRFTFNAADLDREEPAEPEETETNEVASITPSGSVSMYTGGNGRITIEHQGNSLEQTRIRIGSLQEGIGRWLGGQTRREISYPPNAPASEQVQLVIEHSGNTTTIEAVGGGAAATVPIAIERNEGQILPSVGRVDLAEPNQEFSREIIVNTIDMNTITPFTNQEVTNRVEKQFNSIPADQQRHLAVYFPNETTRVERNGQWFPVDAENPAVQVRQNADGTINVRGNSQANMPIWFKHLKEDGTVRPQPAIRRTIEVAEQVPEPDMGVTNPPPLNLTRTEGNFVIRANTINPYFDADRIIQNTTVIIGGVEIRMDEQAEVPVDPSNPDSPRIAVLRRSEAPHLVEVSVGHALSNVPRVIPATFTFAGTPGPGEVGRTNPDVEPGQIQLEAIPEPEETEPETPPSIEGFRENPIPRRETMTPLPDFDHPEGSGGGSSGNPETNETPLDFDLNVSEPSVVGGYEMRDVSPEFSGFGSLTREEALQQTRIFIDGEEVDFSSGLVERNGITYILTPSTGMLSLQNREGIEQREAVISYVVGTGEQAVERPITVRVGTPRPAPTETNPPTPNEGNDAAPEAVPPYTGPWEVRGLDGSGGNLTVGINQHTIQIRPSGAVAEGAAAVAPVCVGTEMLGTNAGDQVVTPRVTFSRLPDGNIRALWTEDDIANIQPVSFDIRIGEGEHEQSGTLSYENPFDPDNSGSPNNPDFIGSEQNEEVPAEVEFSLNQERSIVANTYEVHDINPDFSSLEGAARETAISNIQIEVNGEPLQLNYFGSASLDSNGEITAIYTASTGRLRIMCDNGTTGGPFEVTYRIGDRTQTATVELGS